MNGIILSNWGDFVPQRNKEKNLVLFSLTRRSKPAFQAGWRVIFAINKPSVSLNERHLTAIKLSGRILCQTCFVTFLMYACLSLCEHTRNAVTSENLGDGILILQSRRCIAFGVESLHGSFGPANRVRVRTRVGGFG